MTLMTFSVVLISSELRIGVGVEKLLVRLKVTIGTITLEVTIYVPFEDNLNAPLDDPVWGQARTTSLPSILRIIMRVKSSLKLPLSIFHLFLMRVK